MKNFLKYLFLLLPIVGMAQDKNEFHNRKFWQSSPDVETVKAKIAEGNDPVELTNNGFDALTFAINSNAPMETILFLLSIEGNDVNKPTHDKRNYLMWATSRGNIPLMKYLLEKGSRTDIVDNHGYNLMTFAAAGGQQNTVVYDLILENGGKVNDTNRSGANALLLLASSMKDTKIIDYFKSKGLDIHSTDKLGNGLFNYAAKSGNIVMMDKFIEMGLEYKDVNKEGGNAFMFASAGSRSHTNTLEVYEYLLKLGLEPNIVTKDGKTPLHNVANKADDIEIFEFFKNQGIDVNQADKEGNTPFLNAVRSNNMTAAKYLLNKEKIDYANKDGHTALTFAVRRGALEMITFLKENGASFSVKDEKENNLVYHLFDAYGRRNKQDFGPILDLLLEQDITATDKFEEGNNLIHIAVEKGEIGLIKKAIELGCDINYKNENGLTPLHLAAMKATNDKILTLLLKKGADKNILTDFEESAFDLASENEKLKEKEVEFEFLKTK